MRAEPRGGLTQQRLLEVLGYDPETGEFQWRNHPSMHNRKAGSVQWGPRNKGGGYIRIMIDGKIHHGHRLAWLYVHGHWPRDQIDHIDGDRANNRITNLRDVTPSQNRMNTPRKSKYGRGVRFRNDGARPKPWHACIHKDYKRISLGDYHTQEEAAAAYEAAAKIYHGEFSLNQSRSAK
jgi:hypothetical protein